MENFPSYLTGTPEQVPVTPSFFPVTGEPAITTGTAENRAERYDWALGNRSPGRERLYEESIYGEEENFRARRALEERTKLNLRRAQFIQDYIKTTPNMTEDELKGLQKMDAYELEEAEADPNTFYERQFARKATNSITSDIQESTDPKDPVKFAAQDYNWVLTNQNTARKFVEDAQLGMEDRSWAQEAKMWVPFYRWSMLQSNFEDPTSENGFLLGNNMKDQIENMYRLKPNEFYREGKRIITELREQDPELALQFATALLGYSAADNFLDNTFSALDLSILTPSTVFGVFKLGKALGAGTKTYTENLKLLAAHDRLKTMTKRLGGSKVDYSVVLPEYRRVHQMALDNLIRKAGNTGQVKEWTELTNVAASIINPRAVLENMNNVSVEQAARLEIGMLRTATTALNEIIARPRTLRRMSPEALATASSEAEQELARMYAKSTYGARVASIRPVNRLIEQDQTLANTDAIALYLEKKAGGGYAKEATARGEAKKLGLNQFDVEQVNGEWYIRTIHYVPENTPTMQAFARPNAKFDDKPHVSWLHPFSSRMKSKNTLVPDQLMEDLLVAQSATNGYFQANRAQFLEDFGRLGKQSRRDLESFLERERDYRVQTGGPETVKRGRYAHTVEELKVNFSKELGRMPTSDEIATYFSWKQWNDVDYIVRNLDLTRDMARLGVSRHQLRFAMPGGEDAKNNWTPHLEGATLTKFPWDRPGDAGILVWDASETWLLGRKDHGSKFRKTFMSKKDQEYIDALIDKEGYVVLQLSPWSKGDLADYLRNWGGQGVPAPKPQPEIPTQTAVDPELAKKAATRSFDNEEERNLYIKQIRDEIERMSKLANEGNSPIAKEFGRLAMIDPELRAAGRGLTNINEFANAIADRYVNLVGKANTISVRPLPATGKDQTANSLLNRIISAKVDKLAKDGPGAQLTHSDVQKILKPSKKSRAYSEDETFFAGVSTKREELETAYAGTAAAKLNPDPYASMRTMVDAELTPDIAANYQVAAIKTEQELAEALGGTKKISGSKLTETDTSAPYILISEPGSDLSIPTHVVLNGPMKGIKSTLQNKYPSINFMTVAQSKDFIKKGKIPDKPIAQRADEAAQELAANTDFEVGDTVIRLSPEDKKELAKKGTLEGKAGAEQFVIREYFDDPVHGKYVFLEGSNTGFPAEDVYLVAKKPTYTPYQEGTDIGRYDYILIKPEQDMRSSALNFTRFPYQEGGHRVNEDAWHIRNPQVYSHKQDKATINSYEGDINAYSAVTEADARETATHLENIRSLLRQDFERGTNIALNYYNNHLDGLSKTFKDFKNQFKQFNPKTGYLDVDMPFVVTPKDRSAYDYIKGLTDVDGTPLYKNLENHRDSAHNLFYNELNLQFALERSDNLSRIVRKGTTDQPVFGSETTGNLSPMATLTNSMTQMVRGRVLDDLKIKTANDFASAYAPVIDATLEEIRRDPMDFILNPRWKQGLKGEDAKLLNSARDFRRAYVDFMGVENPQREFIVGIQRSIADQIKQRLGQGSYDWVDRHLLRSSYYNPVRWLNNVTMDLFFGVYNIKQLVVQGMSAFHSIAVSPVHGLQASFAQWLARPLLFDKNPERMATMAKIAHRALGIRPEHFTEAVNAYKNSGFHIIGQSTAIQDDFINQSIKESFIERSREAGRVFFKEGDRISRGTAFITAYLDWRAANPIAKLTPRIEHQLLLRADDLALNMTGASQASMAKGVGNIPLKFTTYYLRLMEQLLPGWNDVRSVGQAVSNRSLDPLRRRGGGGGGRLTPLEKMKAYGVYSALFGVPITASGAFGVWPVWKEWEKYLIENGYDTDENMILRAFNGGLAELLPSLVGVDHNFSEALGPTGSSWMYDIVNGRNELFDIVTGVGGEKVSDTFDEAWPFFSFIANVFRTDDEKYPLTWGDLEPLIRSISSVNNFWKAIQMYNTGVYMSKNKTRLAEDQGSMDAVLSVLFGTNTKEMSKAFLMSDMTRATREMKTEARSDILKYHRLQMKAIAEGDIEKAMEYGKAVKWLVNANGFMPQELNKLFSDSISENGDFIKYAEEQFYKSTPERQRMYMDMIKKKFSEEGAQ